MSKTAKIIKIFACVIIAIGIITTINIEAKELFGEITGSISLTVFLSTTVVGLLLYGIGEVINLLKRNSEIQSEILEFIRDSNRKKNCANDNNTSNVETVLAAYKRGTEEYDDYWVIDQQNMCVYNFTDGSSEDCVHMMPILPTESGNNRIRFCVKNSGGEEMWQLSRKDPNNSSVMILSDLNGPIGEYYAVDADRAMQRMRQLNYD